LKASAQDGLVPINVAARLLGLNASALRYYDERGLVPAPVRARGKR
jgi:DNA-binding transcriptional MerR regulator